MTGSGSSVGEEYDAVTRVHGEIRRWVGQQGGRPTVVDAGEGEGTRLAVRFPPVEDERVDVVDWEEFFERFEERELALAYEVRPTSGSHGSSCEVVDREWIEEVDFTEGTAETERRRREARERADERRRERDVEDRSDVRERAAERTENVDNHRDEPPFDS